MRKFSKILAVILVVALLASSVLAITVSADSDKHNQLKLNISGVRSPFYSSGNETYGDFEDGTGLNGWTSTSTYYKNASYSKAAKQGDNTYLRFYSDGTKANTATSLYADQRFGNGYNSSRGFMYDDIIVSDIEFCADGFVIGDTLIGMAEITKDADGYAVWTESNNQGQTAGAFVMNGEEKILYKDLKLSYLENAAFGLLQTNIDKAGTSTSALNIGTTGQLKYDATTNTWTYKWGTNITLSTVAGEWNHLTMVIKIDNSVNYTIEGGTVLDNEKFDADVCYALIENPGVPYTKNDVTYTDFTLNIANSRVYFYYNGDYVTDLSIFGSSYNTTDKAKLLYNKWNSTKDAEYNLTTTGSERITADGYVIRHQYFHASNTSAGSGTLYQSTRFSMGYDNVALNYYEDGYSGELATFLATDPTQPLYNLNDVVCKGDYNNANASSSFVYANAGDAESIADYDFGVGALDYAAINGGYVVLTKDVLNYNVPADATQSKIYVKLENGAQLTLSNDCQYQLNESATLEGYYELVSPITVNFYFDTASVEAGTPDEVSYLSVGENIVTEIDATAWYKVDDEGNFKRFTAWAYYTDLTAEEGTAFELGTALTEEMYNAAVAAGGTLYVRPTVETAQAFFSITKDDVTTPYFAADDFKANVAAVSGVNTVVLYKDVLLNANDANAAWLVQLAHGYVTLNIDVNGNTLLMRNSASNGRFFGVTQESTINFYSSKPGGIVANSSGRMFDTLNSTAASNVTINFGTYGDIPGSNLTVSSTLLLFTAANGTSDRSYLNFNDTLVYVTQRVIAARGAWTVNLNGSKVVASDNQTSSAYSLFRAQGNSSLLNVNAYNSTILSESRGKVGYTLFNTDTAEAVLNFYAENTEIAANKAWKNIQTEGGTINISLGNNVRIHTIDDVFADLTAKDDSVKVLKATLGNMVKENEIPYYSDAGALAHINVGVGTTAYEYIVLENSVINAAVAGIQYNIATNNGFWVNFYVPQSMDIEVIDALKATVNYGGIDYNVYSVTGISPANVDDAFITVKFKHGDYVCTWTPSASLYDYFNAIINGENYNTYEKALAVNALNYCNEVYNYANGEYNPDYTALLDVEANAALIDTAVVETPTIDLVDTTVIISAQFIVSDGNVAKFAFGVGEVAETLYACYTTYDGREIGIGDEKAYLEDIGDYYVLNEISIYDIVATLTIKTEDGRTVAVYNIAEYLNTEEPDAVGVALYGYAKAAIAYQDYKKTLNQ